MTRSVVTYVLVGLGVVAVDYATFVFLTGLTVTPVPANALAKLVSATVGFFGHGALSFAGAKAHSPVQQLLRYVALLLLNMALTSLLISLALSLGWGKLPAKLTADATAFVVAYFFSQYFVYKRRPNAVQ